MKAQNVDIVTESPSSVLLGGIVYDLTDDPSHEVVRAVKRMQKEISINLVRRHREAFTKKTTLADAMNEIFEDDPEEVTNFADENEEFLKVGTISLATNKMWTSGMIGVLGHKEVEAAYKKCEEFLGGDAVAFLSDSSTNST